MDLDDETLVTKYCENNCREALEQLMDRYLDHLRPLLFQLGVPESDIPDLLQEILIRAFNGLQGFQQRAKFRTWIMSIAVRRVRDYFRSKTRLKVGVVGSMEHVPESPSRGSMEPETWARVEEAIANLSEPYRSAIVLVCLQGLTPSEAAEICQCSRNTLYFRLHSARKKLKIALKDILQ